MTANWAQDTVELQVPVSPAPALPAPTPAPAPASSAPPSTAQSTPRRRGRSRRPLAVVGVALVVATVAWLVSAYVPPNLATSRVDVHGDQVRYALLLAHIGTASVATLTGLVALWPWLRRRYPRLHRWTGRIYFFIGVFPSAMILAPVAMWSESGSSTMVGQLVLAGLWAATGVAGLRAAREHRFADHRAWMVRNYAATLAGIASRPWGGLMALLILPMSDGPIYHGDTALVIHDIASGGVWLGILGNMIIVEAYLQRRPQRRRPRRPASDQSRGGNAPRESSAMRGTTDRPQTPASGAFVELRPRHARDDRAPL